MTRLPALVLHTMILSELCLKGVCIECYQCNSLIDDVRGCSVSPPNLIYLKNCSLVHEHTNERYMEEDIWCRKIRNHRILTKPWHKRSVIRECAYQHWENEICFKSSWQITCECSGNGCNGVPTERPIKTFSLIMFSLSPLLYLIIVWI